MSIEVLMRSIANTPAAQRFLMVAWRLSEIAWRRECEAVTTWLSSDTERVAPAEREEMLRLIQRPLAPTEHPVVVIHCYADVPTGTTWEVAFDRNAMDDHESTLAVSRFGIVYHRVVSRSLSQGWHQVAVIDFPKGVPRLIEDLPADPKTERLDYVCLCAAEDFPDIKRSRLPAT